MAIEKLEINKVLLKAAESGNLEEAQKAINEGVDINTMDKARWTPLHFACAKGNEEAKLRIVALLIQKGADVNARDISGWTPLWLASNNRHYKIVQLLKQHGAKNCLNNTEQRVDNNRGPEI